MLKASFQTCAPLPAHDDAPIYYSRNASVNFAHTMLTVEGLSPVHRKMEVTIDGLLRRFHLQDDDFLPGGLNANIPEHAMKILSHVLYHRKAAFVGPYIDYVLEHVGQQDFCDYLLASLRPRIITHPQRKGQTIAASAHMNTTVIGILARMARITSKHRDLIANHSDLIREAMRWARSDDWVLREECCWIIEGLLPDYESEQTACRRRIDQLRRIGVFDTLRSLVSDDPSTAVRNHAYKVLHASGQLYETDLTLAREAKFRDELHNHASITSLNTAHR